MDSTASSFFCALSAPTVQLHGYASLKVHVVSGTFNGSKSITMISFVLIRPFSNGKDIVSLHHLKKGSSNFNIPRFKTKGSYVFVFGT